MEGKPLVSLHPANPPSTQNGNLSYRERAVRFDSTRLCEGSPGQKKTPSSGRAVWLGRWVVAQRAGLPTPLPQSARQGEDGRRRNRPAERKRGGVEQRVVFEPQPDREQKRGDGGVEREQAAVRHGARRLEDRPRYGAAEPKVTRPGAIQPARKEQRRARREKAGLGPRCGCAEGGVRRTSGLRRRRCGGRDGLGLPGSEADRRG